MWCLSFERMRMYPSSKCEQCPLFDRLAYHVPAAIVPGAKLAAVGEAPGAREVESSSTVSKRLPFVGPAGGLFNSILRRADMERKDITVSNVLKCQPLNNKLPDELDTAIDCCSEILKKDLSEAEVVIAFGNTALYALSGKRGITDRRGSVYQTSSEKLVIGTLHPASLLRQSFMKDIAGTVPLPVIIADVKRAKVILERGFEEPNPRITLFPSEAEKEEFMETLSSLNTSVGVDIETTFEKKTEYCVPLIIAIAHPDWVLCASFDDDLEFIVEALQSKAKKTFHNGVFDVFVLNNVFIKVNNYAFDTLYAHHLLYSELPHKLKFVQSLYTFLPFHKDMKDDLEEIWDK